MKKQAAWRKFHPDLLHLKREWSLRLLRGQRVPKVSQLPRTERVSLAQNVVGIGLGQKTVRGQPQRIICLRFLVRTKYSLKRLPLKHRLPERINGIPTDVVEVGLPRALEGAAPVYHPPHGPIGPGCSISFPANTPQDRTAGSVTAIVTDGQAFFLLSANHVLADEDQVPLGAPVFHPGTLDYPNPMRIGQLDRTITLSQTLPNRIDCALARLDPNVAWTSAIPGDLGAPQGVSIPYATQYISKYGRTTQRRDGQIINLMQDVQVAFRHGSYTMDDQIEAIGFGGDFAEEGDSGSLVVDTYTREAVGLVCAQAGGNTYLCPLGEILAALEVDLA